MNARTALVIALIAPALLGACDDEPHRSGHRNPHDDGCDLCDHVRSVCAEVTSCDCEAQVPPELESCLMAASSCDALVGCGDGGCACDVSAGCDPSCECDPACGGCDTTPACDPGCVSDPDCGQVPIGGSCTCPNEPGLQYCSETSCETSYCLWVSGMAGYCSKQCPDGVCPSGMECVYLQNVDPWCMFL
jgi:hypothetical protein